MYVLCSSYKSEQQKRRQEQAIKSATEQMAKLQHDLKDSTPHSSGQLNLSVYPSYTAAMSQ